MSTVTPRIDDELQKNEFEFLSKSNGVYARYNLFEFDKGLIAQSAKHFPPDWRRKWCFSSGKFIRWTEEELYSTEAATSQMN